MNILIIRLRLVGDVVFTTPAIRALRRRFPDARITYLVERAAAPIVLGNPHLDEVMVIERTRGWRRLRDDLRLARTLRDRGFDLVIDFHGGPRSSWLTRATGAPRRVGYTIPGRGWLYTDRVHRPRELRPRHSVSNQSDLLAPLGIPPLDAVADPAEMTETADARRRVERALAAAGVTDAAELIVMHVSAGNPFRRWPADAFAEVTVALARHSAQRRILLTSGPSDAVAVTRIAQAAREALGADAAGRVVVTEELGLADLRVLVARAALYIGGDSGPLHLAATTRTPIVGIYGPTLRERSEPWRDPLLIAEAVEPGPLPCRPCDQRVCAPGDFRCLRQITPQAVATAADRALARARTECRAPTPAPTAVLPTASPTASPTPSPATPPAPSPTAPSSPAASASSR
jgi:predicted lipopolysaccharide heptosyltransferase III